jgi:acetylornithine deacetylase/succinyl-diaminopimelate desuccinylase-like protein
MHHFVDELGVPVVMPAGTTRPDGAIHAPNEGAAVDDYVDHVRFTARLLERIHRRGGLR